MQGVVYMLVFPHGKRYVGQTTDLKRRLLSHRASTAKQPVHYAIRKYGWENVAVKTLACCITTRRELFRLEAHYIERHNSFIADGRGYNMSAGWTDNACDCSRADCYEQAEARGLCRRHYRQEPDVREATSRRKRRQRAREQAARARAHAHLLEFVQAIVSSAHDPDTRRRATMRVWWAKHRALTRQYRKRKTERERTWRADPANAVELAARREARNARRRELYNNAAAPAREAKQNARAAAVEQVAGGRRPAEVAADFGICYDTIRRWIDAAGVTADPQHRAEANRAKQRKAVAARNAKSRLKREAVLKMGALDKTPTEISRAVGVSRTTVTRWLSQSCAA